MNARWKKVGEAVAAVFAGATVLAALAVLILLALIIIGGLARAVLAIWG